MTDSKRPPSRQKLYDQLYALREQSAGSSTRLSGAAWRKLIAMRALRSMRDDQDRELLEVPAASDWIS